MTAAAKKEKVRPLPGTIWCTKYDPSVQHRLRLQNGATLEGVLHKVEGSAKGLFLPSTKSNAVSDVLAKLYLVESVGREPYDGWTTKWFLKTKETVKPSTRRWPGTFEDQGVSEGVIVAASAKAGMLHSGLRDEQVQLRHDEIVAIGKPLGPEYAKDEFGMFAAPGWVIVKLLVATGTHKSGLVINPQINTREQQGSAQWGTIVETPRGTSYDELGGLAVGVHVSFPYALHAGDHALEWVDFAGGYRAVPVMCLLSAAYEDAPADLSEAAMRGFDDCTEQMQYPERRLVYKNPYMPGTDEFDRYDSEFTEASGK